VEVEIIYYKRMEPLPKKIKIKDNQLVVIEDNSVILSPYEVLN